MKAEITLKYYDAEDAAAVTKAVSPDNFKVPLGLSIETTSIHNEVVTHIKCGRKLSTFIATIDDLLFCVSIAEKTILTAKKLR